MLTGPLPTTAVTADGVNTGGVRPQEFVKLAAEVITGAADTWIAIVRPISIIRYRVKAE